MGYVMGQWYEPQPEVAGPYLDKIRAEYDLGMERAKSVNATTPGRVRGAAINYIRGRLNAIHRLTGLSVWRKFSSQDQSATASDYWNDLRGELNRLQSLAGAKVVRGVGK